MSATKVPNRKGALSRSRQLEARCWQLKRNGMQSSEIGKHLGISANRASALLRKANSRLEALIDGEAEFERRATLARLDRDLVRFSKLEEDAYELYQRAVDLAGGLSEEDTAAAFASQAYQTAQSNRQKVEERRAKLLGVDVVKERDQNTGPTKIEIVMVNGNGPQALNSPSPIVEITQCLPEEKQQRLLPLNSE